MCKICHNLVSRSWKIVRGYGDFSAVDTVRFEEIGNETYAAHLDMNGLSYKISPLVCRRSGLMKGLCWVYQRQGSDWTQLGACEVTLAFDPVLRRIDARCEQVLQGSLGVAHHRRGSRDWRPDTGGGDPLAGGWGAEGAGTNPGGLYS